MKKIFILLVFLSFVLLNGCASKIQNIEGIIIDDYNLFYEADDFQIFVLKEIPDLQNKIGITVEELKDEVCYISITTTNAYIVLYNDKYISLRNGVSVGLFDTYDLIEYGISFECHEK
ncbi:MAG: hypothetical protein CVV58_03860 [Tenericutes bacterium HGW-Tenericutes-3]|nr:MAG: hypothetical protein CVV58_03860 [Tenericutes bacterium HGW-Tenericutes-3]